MFGIQTLRTFVAVAETGGIRGAAERLSRTASAISMGLKQLESDIGAPLFEKQRKNALTHLGRVLLDEGRDLLAHYERSRATLGAIANNERTRTEIACAPSVAVSVLPEVVRELALLPTPVCVRARDMDSRSVSDAVAAGAIDAGIGHYPERVPGLSFTPLFSDRLALVCRSDCPLVRRSSPIAWKELKEYEFLAHGSYGAIRDPAFLALAEHARVHLPNAMSLFALIKAGGGITILSRLLEGQSHASIRFLPLRDPNAHQVVGIIARDDHKHSPATTSFLTTFEKVVRRKGLRLSLKSLPNRN